MYPSLREKWVTFSGAPTQYHNFKNETSRGQQVYLIVIALKNDTLNMLMCRCVYHSDAEQFARALYSLTSNCVDNFCQSEP